MSDHKFITMSLHGSLQPERLIELWDEFQNFMGSNPFAQQSWFDRFASMDGLQVITNMTCNIVEAEKYIREHAVKEHSNGTPAYAIAVLTESNWLIGGYVQNSPL